MSTTILRPGESPIFGRAFDRLIRQGEQRRPVTVHVGILGGKAPRERTVSTKLGGVRTVPRSGSAPPLASIGAKMEFGAKNIPPRPTIGPGTRAAIPAIRSLNKQIVNPRTLQPSIPGAEAAGALAVDRIKGRIMALSSPALSPITARLKGSADPLIDTRSLLRSIRYRVL